MFIHSFVKYKWKKNENLTNKNKRYPNAHFRDINKCVKIFINNKR